MKLKPIRGIIDCNLTIKNAPKILRRELVHAFKYRNPAHVAATRFSPYGYVSPSLPEYIKLAKRSGRDISFPRGIDYSERKLSDRGLAIFNRVKWTQNKTVCVPAAFPQLLIALNREQKIILRAFKEDLVQDRFGTFLYVMPTSTGKTGMLSQQAKILGQRTLVLFNTTHIRNAWLDGLEKFYGLAPRDIGIIQQSTWRIGDCFTLGSIQTLARREHKWEDIFRDFGTLIVDEADLVSAPSYWRFIMSCPARYILGATATDRPEGMQEHIYLRACFGSTRKRLMQTQRDTDTSMTLRKVHPITTPFCYKTEPGKMIDWHDLSEHMMADERRNKLIVHQVIKDLKKGLPCLVVTKRVAHVELLYEMLREKGVKANRLTGETNANKIYTEKLVENILAGRVNCVVATIPAIMRGANLNPLASLHITMPAAKKNIIEQLVGRIRRRAKGKKTCECTYYLDVGTPYLLRLYKRVAVHAFRRLKVAEFTNKFFA